MRIDPVKPAEDEASAQELVRLQRSAYAVEAQLIGDSRIPLLYESVDELRAAPVQWLVATSSTGEILGAVAWQRLDSHVGIDRLVVSPVVHRRGVGRALVEAVLAVGTRFVVATGRENRPARALYESFGFVHVEDDEVIDGLWLARYVLDAVHSPG